MADGRWKAAVSCVYDGREGGIARNVTIATSGGQLILIGT
jgi:hypothetical protein